MPERETWHVTPGDEGWKVKKENSERASSRHDTKQDALSAAKQLAKKRKLGQVLVHKQDGKIHDEFTYGEDPPGTKG